MAELDEVVVVGRELRLALLELLQVLHLLRQPRLHRRELGAQPLRLPRAPRAAEEVVDAGGRVDGGGAAAGGGVVEAGLCDLLADVPRAPVHLVARLHLLHKVALEGGRALVEVAEHDGAEGAELLDGLAGGVGLHDHLDHRHRLAPQQ